MKTKKGAILAVNVAALLLGGTIIFPKLISMPATSIVFGRACSAIVVLYLYSLIGRKSQVPLVTRDKVSLLLVGALLAVHWVVLFYGIKISTVAIAGLAFNSYPVMTALLEPFFFRDRLRMADVTVAFVAFTGVLIVTPSYTASSNLTMGVVMGLIAAFLLSIRNICNRKYVKKYSAATVMMYQLIAVIIILFPAVELDVAVWARHDLIYLILLGTIFTALPHALFIGSMRVLTAKAVSVIASMQPLYAIVFAVLLLNEIPSMRTLVGGVIIVLCSVYESVSHK